MTERSDVATRGGGAVPPTEHLRAITEALDHLLDPLEDAVPSANGSPADEAARASAPAVGRLPAEPIERGYGVRRSLRKLSVRLRWSKRDRFRIPRLIAGWALLVAFFWSVIWFVSSHVSP